MPLSAAARAALEDALRSAAEANRRLLHMALEADVQGRPELARALRDAAVGETGRAFEHLGRLAAGDPAAGLDASLERLAAQARDEAARAEALAAAGEAEPAAWLRRSAAARLAQLEALRRLLDGGGAR
jgi:rubrerythrin